MVVKTFQSETTSVPRAWLKIFKRSPASLSVLWMNPRQGPVCCLWLRRAAQRARHVDRQRESGAGRKGWGCTGGRSTPPFFISCCGMWNIKTWRRDQRSKVELDLYDEEIDLWNWKCCCCVEAQKKSTMKQKIEKYCNRLWCPSRGLS